MNIKFNILIILSAFAIFFAVASQYIWIQKTYSILHSNQENLINLSITKASDKFVHYINDTHKDLDDSLIFAQYHRTPSEMNIYFTALDSILDIEMTNNHIKGVFNYALLCNDSAIYKSDKNINISTYKESKYKHILNCGIFNTGLILYVIADCPIAFNYSNRHINSGLLLGIISMTIIFVIIVLFIRTIRKIQKTTSERIKVINNMAHEFKTPISSIKLAAEMLSKEEIAKDTARVLKYSDLIIFENSRLKFLGDQIFLTAMLEEQQISLNLSTLDANEIIKTYVNNYSEVRPELTGRIKVNLNAAQPFIQTDKGHFENVIKNLIENAFKYGGEEVKVQISTGNQGDNLIITIKDDGIGIPKVHQKKVFNRFYRIVNGNQYNIKGFGIGLYYIRSILSKMGGKIALESSPGNGAKFTIIIKQ